MMPFVNPADVMRLAVQSSMMMAEANMVIALRILGMGGMWRVSPSENSRMVDEKSDAAAQSGAAMIKAAMAGQNVAEVALAGIEPVRAKTQANTARLGKRGPKMPG